MSYKHKSSNRKSKCDIPSQDLYPKFLAVGSQTYICSNDILESFGWLATAMRSVTAVLPNQPSSWSPSTSAEAGDYQ